MKIVVIGAGAVGGYFGGRLAQAGCDVQFLVRERRFQQLQDRGLRVQSTHGDFTIHPSMTTSAADAAKEAKIVILAVKNYQLKSLLPSLQEFVTEGAVILPLLNGVAHFDLLKERLGVNNVIGGTCYIESTLNAEGDVVHTSPMHQIMFGAMSGDKMHAPSQPGHQLLASLLESLKSAGVEAVLSDEILVEVWRKFLFLATFSGVTAAIRVPIGRVLQDEVSRNFMAQLLDEGLKVASAIGVGLPADTVNQIVQRLYHVSPTMTSSLHRDLEKGLPLEVDSLQGAIIELGRTHGVPTPNFSALYAVLHPHKDGHRL